MSDEPANPKDEKREAIASNAPVSLPPAEVSLTAPSLGGFTDRAGWVIIGAMLVGGCVLLLLGVNFVSKILPALENRPISTYTFAPTVLPNLTATQRAWVKPAQSPVLASAQDAASAVELQNTEYLEMRSSVSPFMPEINQPGDIYIYEIHVVISMELLWEYGWCATTENVLAQNFEQMKVEFRLNGAIVGQEHIAVEEYQREDGGYCRTFTALITDWPAGVHQLESRVTFVRPTDDGWNLYPAGTHTFKFFVDVDD